MIPVVCDISAVLTVKMQGQSLLSSRIGEQETERTASANIMAAGMESANGQTYGDQPGEAIQQHIGAFHNPNIKMHYHGNCCVVYNLGTLK